ncbi:hypothetical protein ACP70R_012981 [Stipagrostis hirtigluma subsp. patula]
MAPRTTMAMTIVLAVLLMQCCNVILAARPLPDAAAGVDGGRWLGQGGGALIMQVLDGPGGGNGCGWHDPNHPGGHCP